MIPTEQTISKMIEESVLKGETLEQLVQRLDNTFSLEFEGEEFERHYSEGFQAGLYGNEHPDFLTVLANTMDQPVEVGECL